MTLLAIDDNADILDGIGEILESEGHSVWLAHSADEAMERLRTECTTPDALLLDFRMPGTPAEVFAAALKESPRWSDIPIILLTAAMEEELPADLPVDAVLHKPFRMERLLELIGSVAA